MNNIGEIIKVKNFIFNGSICDHSKIRPCIIISVKNNIIYVLPISSFRLDNKYASYLIPNEYITNNKNEYANLSNSYVLPNCHYKKSNILNDEVLLILLDKYYFYQNNIKHDNHFILIKEDIKERIIALSKQNSKIKIKSKRL